MSVTGIASSILSAIGSSQNSQTNQSNFKNIKSEFQQLGQDLQSGNLTQAETDYTTLSQQLPSSFTNATASSTANSAASTTASTATAQSPLAQAFSQLGQDLQSGNLQGAAQLYSNIQQDLQQGGAQVSGHHHHHQSDSSQSSSSTAASSSNNPIVQAFSTLAQDLQAGNLSGAQSAFATLQNDLQQIGGLTTAGSNGATSAAAPATTGSLNVTV
jgi:outer membrane protein assembly factor BamD (BamD/ComL family)